ncbi:hypothetical protein GGS26DRAFT_577392 [Hypomontagnella submonticulosa]|nr:hypothetical protein GGS26DRAFT_577392 [Hypomontagnella submonticulosa]
MSVTVKFLGGIHGILKSLKGDALRDWLKVEPPLPQEYYDLAAELKSSYQDDAALEKVVESSLPEEDDVPEGQGTTWPGFHSFMKDYLEYWRDVDFDNLLGAHQLLTALTNSCATALNNPTYGTIMLETSMSLCASLSTLSVTLNKHPDLTRKLAAFHSGEEERKSVIEITAEIMQKFFTTCLTDRSSPRYAKPTGKKVGIYIFANKTLKLLTMNSKSYLAAQLLTNIMAKSPPLSYYPASQRVTFLYLLGRFHFNHKHYWRAAQCLQEAYLQTPPYFQKHRRIVLTYLIPCMFILGRIPSQTLLQRPEAQSMAPCYSQLSLAIRKGDYILFQHTIKQYEGWLRRRGFPLFITLQYRIRPLLWRSLSRRAFILTYTPPTTEEDSRKAAVLKLEHLKTAMTFVQKRLEGYLPANPTPKGRQAGVNSYLLKAVSNSAGTGTGDSTLVPPPGGPKHLPPSEGILSGNMAPDDLLVESVVMSLIGQDLLHGYIAHTQAAFAVMGTKQKGSAVAAGWPKVSGVIDARAVEPVVPGWVKDE